MSCISIVVPVYNEQDNIHVLVDALIKVMEQVEPDYEIILVDDGSNDHSLGIIKKLARENTKIRYLSFSRNFGQQAAITAGLDFAHADAIITMDADLQDPPQLIPEMIQAWKSGSDIVLMRRKYRNDGLFKRISASLYYYFLDKFSEYKFKGNVGDFRLIDKKVADELRNLKEKNRYLRGMILWMGYTLTYLDYHRPNRKRGKTGFSLLKMIRLGMDGILNFSLLPLRLGLIIGTLVIFLGFLFLIYIIYDSLWNNMIYQLYKWLSVITFIFTGFLFILIWILGEYIGKIYNEVKNRPIYLVRDKSNFENEDSSPVI
jgi:glycosyltransferase involved in cell wall biosynthesis